MCHIAITPLLFRHEVTMEEIDIKQLHPMTFMMCFALKGKPEFYREELLVHIYTTRNVIDLPIIGNIIPTLVYDAELSWEPGGDKFQRCGDIGNMFGREAYIQWLREQEL